MFLFIYFIAQSTNNVNYHSFEVVSRYHSLTISDSPCIDTEGSVKATATHNFKWVKITYICLIWNQTFSILDV